MPPAPTAQKELLTRQLSVRLPTAWRPAAVASSWREPGGVRGHSAERRCRAGGSPWRSHRRRAEKTPRGWKEPGTTGGAGSWFPARGPGAAFPWPPLSGPLSLDPPLPLWNHAGRQTTDLGGAVTKDPQITAEPSGLIAGRGWRGGKAGRGGWGLGKGGRACALGRRSRLVDHIRSNSATRNTQVLHTVCGPAQAPPPAGAAGPERSRNQLARAERLRQAARDTGWLACGPR